MNTFLTKIISVLIAPIFFIQGLFAPSVPAQMPLGPVAQNVGAALPQATGVFETSLVAPISATATTMTLTANAVRGGGSISGYTCFTVDEGTAQAEVMCGTVSSTAVSAMTRGISYADGITSVTANKFTHRRGADVKITDFPLIQILKAQNNGDVTFPNAVSYDGGITCATSTQICPKSYIDGIAIAGSPDSTTTTKGIGKVSTAPVSPTSPIFVGDNDTRVSTQGENDAQVGNNTDIAVGTSNKFVTQTGTQHNAEKYAADGSGSSTAYTATLSPVPTSYTNGMIVYVKIGIANTTTTPTLNVNGLGAKTIVKGVNTSLAVGDISANQFCTFQYDGTNMVYLNPPVTQYQEYFFTSTGTWIAPRGVTSVLVDIVGGGGGGGASTSGQSPGGGGGGGGAGGLNVSSVVTPLTLYTVTIGVGGVAGATNGGNGGTGGTSSFNGISKTGGNGGTGGTTVFGAGGTAADSTAGAGGAGGAVSTDGSNGTAGTAGGSGGTGSGHVSTTGGGGGGGASGIGTNGGGGSGASGTATLGAGGGGGSGAGVAGIVGATGCVIIKVPLNQLQ